MTESPGSGPRHPPTTPAVAAGTTAIVLPVSELDPLVAEIRRAHDPVARMGVPAHITIAFPFMPSSDIDASVDAQLEQLFSEQPPIQVQFRTFGQFPTVLYLQPEPDGVLTALIKRVEATWPDYPLYGGAFPTVIPHVSVAQGAVPQRLQEIREQVARGLPVRAELNQAWLLEHATQRWKHRATYQLAGS